jgi:hypothetical protein
LLAMDDTEFSTCLENLRLEAVQRQQRDDGPVESELELVVLR